ncbi:MAG: hypothetical protein QXO97_06655 [Candidatus Nezhaarchaeales archaeon]
MKLAKLLEYESTTLVDNIEKELTELLLMTRNILNNYVAPALTKEMWGLGVPPGVPEPNENPGRMRRTMMRR